MESEIEAGDRGVVGDEMFHEAITAAAHSSLLAKLMNEISGLIRETRIESLSQEDRPRASLKGHRRIAEAVRRQDARGASRAMADHLRLVSDVALLRDSN
jgi:GntR family transcriptional repressor for pyruvate dehydrogenase complex